VALKAALVQNVRMPNVAAVLKDEVTRIARKEVKRQLQALQKSASSYRSDIAALRRRVQELERGLRKVGKVAKPHAAATADEADGTNHRFSAKGFASLRKRLGLTAEDFGTLIGSSALSVYKWEGGKVTPRPKYLAAIASIRGIGKREAAKRLEASRQ
jgi:DNA-binding transcriptional regulator YiaG